MFKWNHKAKTQQSINHTNLACELTSFLTHFINQIRRLKEMIKNESKKKMFHLQKWTSDWNKLTENNHEVTWFSKCLEFVPLIKTNIFGFWIKWFGVEMRKLWLKQDTKNHEENSALLFQFSLSLSKRYSYEITKDKLEN